VDFVTNVRSRLKLFIEFKNLGFGSREYFQK